MSIAAMLAVLGVAGCGAASDDPSSPSDATTGVQVEGALPDVLAVFEQARRTTDDLPAAAAQALTATVDAAPTALHPGRLVFSESRLLLDNLGSQGRALYAVPTTKGHVCLVMTKGGGIGCASAESFEEQGPLSWGETDLDEVGEGQPIFVDGLVLDDVVGVQVIDDENAVHPALLENNAFFYEHERPDAWTKGVVLTYRDGSQRTIPMPGGPPPGLE